MNQKLAEKELEFIEAEIRLEEALEDMENALKINQREEEKRSVTEKDSDLVLTEGDQDEVGSDEEDDGAPTSFGTVVQGETDKGEDKPGKSPFSSLSMSIASYTLISMVPSKLQESFLSWKRGRCSSADIFLIRRFRNYHVRVKKTSAWSSFPAHKVREETWRAVVQGRQSHHKRNRGHHQMNSLARVLSCQRACKSTEVTLSKGRRGGWDLDDKDLSKLSMHVLVTEIFTLS